MRNRYTILLNFSTLVLACLLSFSQAFPQQIITQWTFEGDVLTPSTGSGTASNIGGTSTAFATGNGGGRGWNTSAYPAQGQSSATAGVQFLVSTSGHSNIVFTWDQRHSNTSANRVRVKYTLDGNTWLDFIADETNANNMSAGNNIGFDNGRFIANAGDTWFNRSASFINISGANNNPNFGIRIVSEFFDGTNYAASTPTSSYGTSGTWRFDNVTFSAGSGQGPIIMATPSSLSGFTYLFNQGPSGVQTYQLSASNLEGAGNVVATAPQDFEISLDGTTFVSALSFPISGGSLTGQPITISVRMKAGLATGAYQNQNIVHSGGNAPSVNVDCSGYVTSATPPSMTEVILPRFTQGSTPANPNRIPLAYRMSFQNLLPNSVYRYYNKIVLSTDDPTYNGAGNCIFVKPDGTFIRTTSTSLNTPGQYGEFTTTANGTYEGWFITEPTGNARFKPGNQIFIRIMLNDGSGGTDVATRLTSVNTITCLNFGTESRDTLGSAIRAASSAIPKNFVFFYDNVGGSGRPLFGTSIETTGINFAGTASYAPFYGEIVQGVNGSWGAIIPNVNPNGLKRIEQRKFEDGSIVSFHFSNDGKWSGVDTRNPTNGLNPLVINVSSSSIDDPEHRGINIYLLQGNIMVELKEARDGYFRIFDITGRTLKTGFLQNGTNQIQLDLTNNRLILIEVSTSDSTIIRKIIY